jgi:riboflavin kinase/FMN adenylyltransferase
MYDGIHRGHQDLIGTAVARARTMNRPCLLLTFDPHPAEVVRPGSHPAILTSMDRKAELVAGLGVDAMCVPAVHRGVHAPAPETFTHTVLVEHLHAGPVVVGENFYYGLRRGGTSATLAQEGAAGSACTSSRPAGGDTSPTGRTPSPHPRPGLRRRRGHGVGARALGRPLPSRRVVVRGDPARAGSWATRPRTWRAPPFTAIPSDGVLRRGAGHPDPAQGRGQRQAPGRRSRSAPTRRSRAAGARSRRTCSTSTATSTASTSAWSSCSGCARWPRSPASRTWSPQMDRDVARTREVMGADRQPS